MSFLSYQFDDTPDFVETYDEAPLWSAAFGLLMLKHLKLSNNLIVLDLGSGTGFPLLELAGRMGESCTIYGVDPWKNATNRCKKKIKNYELKNVEIIESSAESLPFTDNSIDLIVSNLGINNFDEREKVIIEAYRILKPGGRIALTTNLNGHWKEFYTIFDMVLNELEIFESLPVLAKHQQHRGTVESTSNLFSKQGFQIVKAHEEIMTMNFANGSAFFNHYFVKLGWLESWLQLVPSSEQRKVFTLLEHKLNEIAEQHGDLQLTVPMLYLEVQKTYC